MTSLAIIPARGGSKRLPGKSLKVLGKLPLVLHTIEAAKNNFDKIIFTSDSYEIIDVVDKHIRKNNYTNISTSHRPAELASDTSKVIDTVNYYFDKHDTAEHNIHHIWLLLPTCPLRTSNDIFRAGALLREDGVDGVISVTDPEFPPSLHLIERYDGCLTGLDPHHPFASGNSRSQDQPTTFRPNGAIYGMWWELFRHERNFYRGNIKGYHMPRERSVDIDNMIDFKLAEVLLNERG